MPRASRKKKVAVPPFQPKTEEDELRVFSAEAEQVDLLTKHPGWAILKRDLEQYRKSVAEALPYLDPKSPRYAELRIRYIAGDMLIKMVEDYDTNRKKTLEWLDKIDHPEEEVILDVDN